jgi:diguanylate cyclase (GGDEF)-like protein
LDSLALTYAVVFSIIATVSAVLGIVSLTSEEKNDQTWLFFAIAVCLSVWSLGFAMSVAAPTEALCLIWRRFSALGWGSLYAVFLEFSISLAMPRRRLFQDWTALVRLIPAAVTVYVFAVSGGTAQAQYRFVRLPAGWTNAAVNNGWDMFFYAYMGSYVLASALLLLYGWRKGPDENSRKQARLLLITFGVTFILGTLTDLVNNSLRLLDIPQMAPVLFLLPLIAIYFGMNRYRFLMVNARSDEMILTGEARKKLVGFLAFGSVAGGLIYFPTQYLIAGAPLLTSVVATLLFFGFGGLLLAIRRRTVRRQNVETTFVVSAIITIPLVTMHFIRYAGITVWAFPFIFILLSLMFNTRNLLIASSVSIFFTQLLVWGNYPHSSVTIDASDFITRIGIFVIVIWIALYVNRVTIARLRENVEQNRYQRLISRTSSLLVSNESVLEENIRGILAEACGVFSADAAFLYLFNPDSQVMTRRFVWTAREDQQYPLPEESCCELNCHLIREGVTLNDRRAVSAQGLAIAPHLHRISARAFLSMPLQLTATSAGFLGLSVFDTPKNWRADQVDTIRIIANNASDRLAKLAAEKEMAFMAYHDFLTRLPNRLLFIDRTEQAIALAHRTEKLVGVMFLDLDAFKSVNDTLGHRAGDELIKEVAKKLMDRVRASDTISRFGGDEFLIMLNNIVKQTDIMRAADSIMALFEKPFILNGQELFVTASAGIAVYPYDGEDTDTLIKNADIAMYNAKERGKNHYLFCSEEMKEDVLSKVRLTNSLYRVLERGELRVYYQPQIDLETNRINGAEALLRWMHPELGMVSPGVFIPLAEKSGLIGEIGRWVLNEAVRQLRQWRDKGLPEIRVAVNISVSQLRNPLFAAQVGEILLEHDLEPRLLELEVTESAAIKEPAYIVTMLESLKELGVFLSIDDFGTEYSSLSRLKQLPVDRIKIDMQFVQGIDKNEKDRAISKVIINLAKSLGMKVIAEGVETREQLSYLNQKLCDEVQGYYYYRPMPAGEFERVLARMDAKPEPPKCDLEIAAL